MFMKILCSNAWGSLANFESVSKKIIGHSFLVSLPQFFLLWSSSIAVIVLNLILPLLLLKNLSKININSD